MGIRDGGMALQLKCLPHKRDDPRSDSQNLGVVCSSSQTCNLSTLLGRWEAARRIPRSLLVTRKPRSKWKVEISTQGCPLHITRVTHATHTYRMYMSIHAPHTQ